MDIQYLVCPFCQYESNHWYDNYTKLSDEIKIKAMMGHEMFAHINEKHKQDIDELIRELVYSIIDKTWYNNGNKTKV